jgi:hypothetical protein
MSKFRSQQFVVSALLSLALLNACGKSPEQARRELGELGIPYTPDGLQQAVENKDTVAIDLFIKSGFDISPAFTSAIRQGDRELIKKLLDNKVDVNYQNGVPLHSAVVNNDPETAKLLLSGPDLAKLSPGAI